MHLERSFAHVLDAGGARRTTLRGRVNLNKRFKVSAAIYNLSQLMRQLFGLGTPKQFVARAKAFFGLICLWIVTCPQECRSLRGNILCSWRSSPAMFLCGVNNRLREISRLLGRD